MSGQSVLVIRHEPHEGPGLIEEALEWGGFKLEFVDSWKGAEGVPASPAKYAAVIVMGGSMGVYEAEKYPFLSREIDLMKNTMEAGVPLLGICLGSQLLAAACGAKVYPGGKKEIGWYPVTMDKGGAAKEDPLLGGCPPEFMSFHWHGDTFDLPVGAERLASSQLTLNQAFRVGGKAAWALQFHPEVTEVMIHDWVKNGIRIGEITGTDAEKILGTIPAEVKRFTELGRAIFGRFAELLAEATTR